MGIINALNLTNSKRVRDPLENDNFGFLSES